MGYPARKAQRVKQPDKHDREEEYQCKRRLGGYPFRLLDRIYRDAEGDKEKPNIQPRSPITPARSRRRYFHRRRGNVFFLFFSLNIFYHDYLFIPHAGMTDDM
jgi:hypothetical protein